MTSYVSRWGLMWAALTLMVGCVRFGYDPHHNPVRNKSDAGQDASMPTMDSAISDTGSQMDANPDTGMKDATPPKDAAMDAGKDADVPADTGMPNDGAPPNNSMDAEMDADMQDANMQDADMEDAAPDAEVEAGPPSEWCPERNDALLCDDFEDSTLSRWSYEIVEQGTLGHSTVRSHSPSGSLRATTDSSGLTDKARKGSKALGHLKSGEIWLRYWYYLPSTVSVNQMFSTCVVAEVEAPYFGFSLAVLPTRVDLRSGSDNWQGTMAFPRNTWTCVELHVKVHDTAGFAEAFINGTLVANTPAMDTLPDMGYTSVDVGIHYADPAQNPVTAYVDDVVAGTKRYGCN